MVVLGGGGGAAWDQKQEVDVTNTGMAPKRENTMTTMMKTESNPFI